MAKLWAKVNGTWVQLGAQSKDDIGLGNVQNFTYTNSATDGSSSKYATGAAAKQAYDRATQALNKANGSVSLSSPRYTGYGFTYKDDVTDLLRFYDSNINHTNTVFCGFDRDRQKDHYRLVYRTLL